MGDVRVVLTEREVTELDWAAGFAATVYSLDDRAAEALQGARAKLRAATSALPAGHPCSGCGTRGDDIAWYFLVGQNSPATPRALCPTCRGARVVQSWHVVPAEGPPSAPAPACARCAFWRVATPDTGLCHRFPPVPHPDGGGRIVETGPGYWCGEYRAKEE